MEHEYLTNCNCETCKLYRFEHGLTKDKHDDDCVCPKCIHQRVKEEQQEMAKAAPIKSFLWVCKICGNKWLSSGTKTECQFCKDLKELKV